MATRERGVVVMFNADKGFGFIQRQNQPPTEKNTFFHVSENPQGKTAGAGDRVEYEYVAIGKKGKPEARGLTIVAKASAAALPVPASTTVAPAPAGAAPLSPPPTVAPLPEPLDYNVEFMFSDSRYPDPGNRFELDVAVFVTNKDGIPVKGAQLEASTQYGLAVVDLNTGLNGEAPFTIQVDRDYDIPAKKYIGQPLDITNLTISVTVYHLGKKLVRNELWPRKKLKALPALQAPPTPKTIHTTNPATPAAAEPALTSLVSTAPDGATVIDVSPATATSTLLPAVASPPDPAALTAPTPAAPATTTLAAAVSPAPLSPASAPPPPPPEPDNLIVNIEAFPNAEGFFLTTVSTRLGNDPVKGKFRFFSGNKMEAKLFDGNSIGTGLSVSYETDDDGTIEFLLNCDANQTRIVFKLQNGKGKEVAKLFCKPPAFKEPA